MAQAIPALLIASTAVSAFSAVQQGRARKQAAQKQAAIDTRNAQLEETATALRLQQERRQNVLRIGTLNAQAGAKHMGSAGSVLDIIGDTARQGALQQKFISDQGAARVDSFNMSASAARSEGSAAQTSGYLAAAGDLMGGAADYYQRVG